MVLWWAGSIHAEYLVSLPIKTFLVSTVLKNIVLLQRWSERRQRQAFIEADDNHITIYPPPSQNIWLHCVWKLTLCPCIACLEWLLALLWITWEVNLQTFLSLQPCHTVRLIGTVSIGQADKRGRNNPWGQKDYKVITTHIFLSY